LDEKFPLSAPCSLTDILGDGGTGGQGGAVDDSDLARQHSAGDPVYSGQTESHPVAFLFPQLPHHQGFRDTHNNVHALPHSRRTTLSDVEATLKADNIHRPKNDNQRQI
jgi:hypothetical protein